MAFQRQSLGFSLTRCPKKSLNVPKGQKIRELLFTFKIYSIKAQRNLKNFVKFCLHMPAMQHFYHFNDFFHKKNLRK